MIFESHRMADGLVSKSNNHLMGQVMNHESHGSTKDSVFFNEGSLDHMIPHTSHQHIAHFDEPGTPKHELQDLMKQSFSAYQLCEERDHSSYFDERSFHQNAHGMFSDSSNVFKGQEMKSEETFSCSYEHIQPQQAPPPFKVTLAKPPSLRPKFTDSSIAKRGRRRKGQPTSEDTHVSAMSTPKSFSIDHEPKKRRARKKRLEITKCPHLEAEYYANGMCHNCYHQVGRSQKPATCHSDRNMYSKGLCKNCYLSGYHKVKRQTKREEKRKLKAIKEAAKKAAQASRTKTSLKRGEDLKGTAN